MRWVSPLRLILLGLVMVLAGVIIPLLMVTRVLEPTLFLSFFSYISSVMGVLIGLIGAALYARIHRP